MIISLLRKILYVIVLLSLVSLISFWLSKQIPGDDVMDYLSIDDGGYNTAVTPDQFRKNYQRVANLRGLDLPEFYFSIFPRSVPDSIQYILPLDDRKIVKEWVHVAGNGQAAMDLYAHLRQGLSKYCDVNQKLCQFYNHALATQEVEKIHDATLSLIEDIQSDTSINIESKYELEHISRLSSDVQVHFSNNILPVFYWHGTQNQYHQWMKGLLLQKPLTSLVDGRNAWSKIYDALKWTLVLNGFAFIFSIVFGVLIGIWSATHDGKKTEKIVNWFLFALFALPSFWLGTLFIYFFASGEWLTILPSGGLGPYHTADSFAEQWSIIGTHLLLPVACLTVGALAYISRQMKQSVIHEYDQPYVAMLRAQGVSERTILRKHIIGNALFPIITLMGGAIPALLSGSLIIEVIFSIPGMGRLMYNSLMSRDWPVAFPILMFGAIITILSYIITDIVYKWADPRVKVLQA